MALRPGGSVALWLRHGGLASRAPGLLPSSCSASVQLPAHFCHRTLLQPLVTINSTAVIIGVHESFESSGKHGL